MKVISETTLAVISANEKPSMDGKTNYYNLAVMQNGEVANVSCEKTVYEDVSGSLRPNVISSFRFEMAVDLTYKSVKIIRVFADNNNNTDNKTDSKTAVK